MLGGIYIQVLFIIFVSITAVIFMNLVIVHNNIIIIIIGKKSSFSSYSVDNINGIPSISA
jgi:hypothetical protein